jgi:hypothetical protein
MDAGGRATQEQLPRAGVRVEQVADILKSVLPWGERTHPSSETFENRTLRLRSVTGTSDPVTERSRSVLAANSKAGHVSAKEVTSTNLYAAIQRPHALHMQYRSSNNS